MVNLFILILSWTTYASIQIMLRNECLFSFNFIELNHEKRIFYSFVSWPFFLCSWFCFLFWAPMLNWISSSCRPKQLEQILKQTTMLKWFTISPFWNFESSHFCSGFVNPNREMFFKLPTSNLQKIPASHQDPLWGLDFKSEWLSAFFQNVYTKPFIVCSPTIWPSGGL